MQYIDEIRVHMFYFHAYATHTTDTVSICIRTYATYTIGIAHYVCAGLAFQKVGFVLSPLAALTAFLSKHLPCGRLTLNGPLHITQCRKSPLRKCAERQSEHLPGLSTPFPHLVQSMLISVIISSMEMLVNIRCPRCGAALIYEEGLGSCLLCARYFAVAGNMVVEVPAPNTSQDDSRQLAENIQEIMEPYSGD